MAIKSSANTGGAKNVTKKHLVDQICRRSGLPRHDVQAVVQGVFDEVIEAVGSGQRIEIRDFGVFEVKPRAARTAQNPKTLEPVQVQPKLSVRFKPGRLMKAALEQGLGKEPQEEADAATQLSPVDPSLNGHARAGEEPPMVEAPWSDRMHAGATRR